MEHELVRPKAPQAHGVVDTLSEPAFDDLARLAAYVCATPIAVITLSDATHQWYKSVIGMPYRASEHASAFCASTIASAAPTIITDARDDPRFAHDPLVITPPGMRFYGGVPIRAPSGSCIGALAVLDRVPRELSASQIEHLHMLAAQVTAQLELQRERQERRLAEEQQHPTQQRAAEQRLHQALDLLRIGGKLGQIGGWATDLAKNEVYWSDEIFAILEWETANPPSLEHALDLYPPEWRGKIRAAIQACARDGTPFDLELELLTAKQRRLWVRALGEAERAADGTITRVVGALQDISEQKHTEAELQRIAAQLSASAERFRLVAQATADAIWDWNLLTDGVWWNSGMQTLFGYPPEELEQGLQAWVSHIHPEDAPRVLQQIQECIDGAANEWESRYRFQRKDGTYAQVIDRAFVLRNPAGQALRMMGGMSDITEQVALEEQLRQAQRLEAVGQLTSGMAHDFNNLLTVILGNAELIQEELVDVPRLRLLAKMIASAAQRGADLTQRLLAFARRQTLDPRPVDVNSLISGMDVLLRRTLGEHIEIEMVLAADLWPALVDPVQLESALLNLCINSRDAMANGGRLTIETANTHLDEDYASQHAEVQAGQYALLAVSDNGIGIEPKNIAHVFEPFFTTKEQDKGSGLGLSMVYGFMQQSLGHIKLYSEPGHGTTLKLYLPHAGSAHPHILERLPGDHAGGIETILLVEDDALVRKYAQRQLESLGYTVVAAANGPEALILINERTDIGLLFTDIVMPGGMSGRELADQARALKPHLKILYTSGYTDHSIVHHGRLDPGIQLLSKPYRRAELARKVRDVLEHPTD